MLLKKISPAGFALALLCFFLPFVQVSCQGKKVATANGFELMSGPQSPGPGQSKTSPNYTAVLAFLAGAGALGLCFARNVKRHTDLAAASGGFAVLMLFALRAEVAGGMPKQTDPMGFQIEYLAGYWSCVLLMLASSIAIWAHARYPELAKRYNLPPLDYSTPGQGGERAQAAAVVCGGAEVPLASRPLVCGQCGAPMAAGQRFCAECGSAQ